MAVVYWFTYQDDGSQRWMPGVGDVEGNRIVISELMDTRGGRFGRSFDPASMETHDWGELTLKLDCANASASYTVSTEGFSSGSQSLVHLTRLANSGCSD